MKNLYVLTFLLVFVLIYQTNGQSIELKGGVTKFMRKIDVSSRTIELTASNINAPITVTLSINSIKKPSDLRFSSDPLVIKISDNVDYKVPIIVSTDTSERNEIPYTLSIKYQPAVGPIKEFFYPIILQPYSEASDVPSIIHNDFLLFTGANFDPVNENNKLNNFSFEGIFKYDIGKDLHMRIGGYSNRNFSVDTSNGITHTRFTNTKPSQPLVVGSSEIAVQSYSLDTRTTTRSTGLYADFLYDFVNKKDLRLSVVGHFEYVRRIIIPAVSINGSVLRDTIIYTQELADRNVVSNSFQASNENVFAPRRNLDQHYWSVGVSAEKATKSFDIFIQSLLGYAINNTTIGRSYMRSRYLSLNIKGQATLKALNLTLAIDLKDINTHRPFTNVSIGIPISAKTIAEKFK